MEAIGEFAFFDCCKLFEVNNFSSITLTDSALQNGSAGAYAAVINTSATDSIYSEENGFITATTTYGKTLIAYIGEGGKVAVPNGIEAICDYAFYPNFDITSVTFETSPAYCGINTLPKAFN